MLDQRTKPDRDARREAIIDVATGVFMEVGFDAASMSSIAARVGGSKGTLYNYFRSKEELFEASVHRHCAWYQEAISREFADPALDIAEVLRRLGLVLLDVTLSEVGLRNFALVASESRRVPAIGRTFYEAGPATGARRMADGIAQAIAEGRLRPCDPTAAAHQFIGLCQNRLLKARLCGIVGEPDAAEKDAEVAAAVRTFMAAYGPLPREAG